jgi:mono/diheme cytochrome c family protein
MTRFLVFVLLAGITALGTESSSVPAAPDQAPVVTFNKDVLPILQNNCQTCHRPGGIAPMSLLTYESARPWAKAIKTAVVTRQMPPWFADPHFGEFRNAPKLTEADIRTLTAWAETGSREGNPADKPAAIQWTDGWRIKPDVVVSMPEAHVVPAKGVGEIQSFFVPNPFKEYTWVSSIEIRPGDPSVVHHVIVQIPEQLPAAAAFRDVVSRASATVCADCTSDAQVQKVEKAFAANPLVVNDVPRQGGSTYSDQLAKMRERMSGQGVFTTMEAVYAPGSSPLDFRSSNSAKLIRGGKPIRIEVHYTPNGKQTSDKTMVGFTLAKGPAPRRFVIMAPEHLVDARKPIPAGENNWETKGELTFNEDAELVWFMPHMHLRGKDMSFRLIYPNGREETVLNAKFNFHWQLGYEVEEPIKVTKGTRMVVTAHHDNSANNPLNPAPNQDAVWGEMTSQEMMLPWFGVVVDRSDAQPERIASYRPGDFDGRATNLRLKPGVAGPTGPIVQPAILRSVKRN